MAAAIVDLFSLAGVQMPLGFSPRGVCDAVEKERVFVESVVFGVGFREWDHDSVSATESPAWERYQHHRSEGYSPLDAAVLSIPELTKRLRPPVSELERASKMLAPAAKRSSGWGSMSGKSYARAMRNVIESVRSYLDVFEDATDEYARASSRLALYALAPCRLEVSEDLEESLTWLLPEMLAPHELVEDWRLKGDTERNRLKNANRLAAHDAERKEREAAEALVPKAAPPPGGFRSSPPSYSELGLRVVGGWEMSWRKPKGDKPPPPKPIHAPLPMVRFKDWVEAEPKHVVEVKQESRCDYFVIRDHDGVLEVQYRVLADGKGSMLDCIVLERDRGWNRTRLSGWCREQLQDPLLGFADPFEQLRSMERFGGTISPESLRSTDRYSDSDEVMDQTRGIRTDDCAGLPDNWLVL